MQITGAVLIARLQIRPWNIRGEHAGRSTHREMQVVSATTPDLLFRYFGGARHEVWRSSSPGTGSAAHLPGMVAAKTVLLMLGVPRLQSQSTNGMDSLLSIMPYRAASVDTLAISKL